MSTSTLTLWVQKAKAQRRAAGTLSESEAEELRRLRREVRILREERDILKKATAFFAKQDR
jgi:transposase